MRVIIDNQVETVPLVVINEDRIDPNECLRTFQQLIREANQLPVEILQASHAIRMQYRLRTTLKVFEYLNQNFNMILLTSQQRDKFMQCIMNKCHDMAQQIDAEERLNHDDDHKKLLYHLGIHVLSVTDLCNHALLPTGHEHAQ